MKWKYFVIEERGNTGGDTEGSREERGGDKREGKGSRDMVGQGGVAKWNSYVGGRGRGWPWGVRTVFKNCQNNFKS